MKIFLTAWLLSTSLCLSPLALADTDPLRAFDTESITGAKKLARTLSGSAWTYHYAGNDYPFRFGTTGQIERFKEWPNVHWRVIGPEEVLLDRPDWGSILIKFNQDVTTFQCRDWSRQPATGSLTPEKP